MLPDRADLSVPAPRPRAVLRAVAVTVAALGVAVATCRIAPRAPAAPPYADAQEADARGADTAGLRAEPAALQARR